MRADTTAASLWSTALLDDDDDEDNDNDNDDDDKSIDTNISNENTRHRIAVDAKDEWKNLFATNKGELFQYSFFCYD